MQFNGQISGKVTQERRDGGERRKTSRGERLEKRKWKRGREIVQGRTREKERIGESEAGNETVLGQS